MNYDVLLCPEKQSFFHLQLGSVVQTDPAATVGLIGLEQAPAGRAFSFGFLHNGEDTRTRIPTGAVVCAGSFTDAQVVDANTHLVGAGCGLRCGRSCGLCGCVRRSRSVRPPHR